MAEPTQNYVPQTADFRILSISANDKTIESAVLSTVGGGPYTNFDSLRLAANTSMLDDSITTRGVTPTSSNDFRGYPKPEFSIQYTIQDYGDGLQIWCEPILLNSVGFSITLTLNTLETYFDVYSGIPIDDTNTYWFTFNAGSTTVDSDSGNMATSGSKYRISYISISTSGGAPSGTLGINASSSSPAYYTEGAVKGYDLW